MNISTLKSDLSASYIHVLDYLYIMTHRWGYEDEIDAKKRLLNKFKEKRKGLTNEQIKEKGLNVYQKKDVSIDRLFQELIDKGFLEGWVGKDVEKRVAMTEQGYQYLIITYTQDFCQEFEDFMSQVMELVESKDEPDISPVYIAKMFWENKDLSYIEKEYHRRSEYGNETEEYHKRNLIMNGFRASSDDFIFHIAPTLYVGKHIKNVSLEIKGGELSYPVVIDRPYPNKQYIVGKYQTDKGLSEIYSLINGKELPSEKHMTFLWKIGEDEEIIHEMEIEFIPERGRFFSTHQDVSGWNTIPRITLSTEIGEFLNEETMHIDDIPFSFQNRNQDIEIDGNKAFIKEKVQLRSFPMHRHMGGLI